MVTRYEFPQLIGRFRRPRTVVMGALRKTLSLNRGKKRTARPSENARLSGATADKPDPAPQGERPQLFVNWYHVTVILRNSEAVDL